MTLEEIKTKRNELELSLNDFIKIVQGRNMKINVDIIMEPDGNPLIHSVLIDIII